jgi:hypothetical protein
MHLVLVVPVDWKLSLEIPKLTQDIDVDIFVDVAEGVGSITAVVPRVRLDHIPYDDFIPIELTSWIWCGLLNGFPIVNPLDGWGGTTFGLTHKLNSLLVSRVHELRLTRKVGSSYEEAYSISVWDRNP